MTSLNGQSMQVWSASQTVGGGGSRDVTWKSDGDRDPHCSTKGE